MNTDMKQIFRFTYMAVFATVVLMLNACSTDDDIMTSNFSKFNFNIKIADEGTRAASDTKTAWAKNDVIVLVINKDEKAACKLTYNGSDWTMADFTGSIKKPAFEGSGTVQAVYSETLTGTALNNLTIKGDVLYTNSGTYVTNEDGVTDITVTMSRPLAKIRINGIYQYARRIDGFKEFCYCKGLSEGVWQDKNASPTSTRNAEGESNGEGVTDPETGLYNYTYYGLLEPDENGNTTIKLKDARTPKISYTRTFEGKVIKPGDNIVIEGPYSETEGHLWASMGVEAKIKVSSPFIVLPQNNTEKLSKYITFEFPQPTDKTLKYESSDPSVATVDANGIVTSHNLGTATITATTVDNNSASIDVNVKDVPEFVDASRCEWGNSFSPESYVGYKFVNDCIIDLVLTKVQFLLPDAESTDEYTPGYSVANEVVDINETVSGFGGSTRDKSIYVKNPSTLPTSKLRIWYKHGDKEYFVLVGYMKHDIK